MDVWILLGGGGAQICDWGMGRDTFVESLWQGGNAFLYCNWNPTFSSANTSSFNTLVPIFTSQVLGTIGQSNTYFFLLPLTQHLMLLGQNQNSCSTFLVERNYLFGPLFIGACVPCLPLPTLALQDVHEMSCIAQHQLVELGGNVPLRSNILGL